MVLFSLLPYPENKEVGLLAGLRAQLVALAGETHLPLIAQDAADLLRRFRDYQAVLNGPEESQKKARERLAEAFSRLRKQWGVSMDQTQSWYEDFLLYQQQGHTDRLIAFLENGCQLNEIDLAG